MMVAHLRRPQLVAALIAVGGLAVLALLLLAPGYAQTPPPEAPPQLLGNPSNLAASPGTAPGSVALRWTPGANAAAHFVYLVKPGGSGGRYWTPQPGDAGSETVSGLEIGQPYWFIVIAGRPAPDDASSYQWSQWSNWAQGVAGAMPPPPTPPQDSSAATPTPVPAIATPTPAPVGGSGGRVSGAEVEGRVIAVDAAARTLTLWYDEHEHFRGARPPIR